MLRLAISLCYTAISSAALAATPASAPGERAGAEPTSMPAWAVAPRYAVPYRTPTTREVKDVLDRVRNRLEIATGVGIVQGRDRQPIADLSKPVQGAQLDRGPEGKFAAYSYPTGVIFNGMLLANEVTGDAKYADFVVKRFNAFADNLPKLASWPREGRGNPFRQMYDPRTLDDCGAMGASMARAKRMNVGPDLHEVIDRFADYISTKQFRLDDGTLARKRPFPQSLWLDDAYMSVPLLAQYGKITGDRKYFDDAARQIKKFYSHLFVAEKGLFTHGGNMDNVDFHPNYFWGRANGWVMVATVELLDLLPEDHPDRDALIKILRSHAKGIGSLQSGSGLWHQMLDRIDSYEETSCTAMFTYSMAKGVNRGWLNVAQYGPVAQAGWNGLTTHISAEGRLDGVCIGTSYADDYIYYYHRPATDDIHGYGPVLLAGSEMIRLLSNDRIRVNATASSPVFYVESGKEPGE